MKVSSLKELQQIVALCRKTGVTSIKIDNIELQLGSAPSKPAKSIDYSVDFPEANIKVPQYQAPLSPEAKEILQEELTQEQLMFYSSVPQDQSEQAQ